MSQFRKSNLTCINRSPVYSEHKTWPQWDSV